MSSNLVIVESPTKARTLSKYLGSKYQIEASMGHVRDLPKAELGVDVEGNFEPKYIIPRDKKKKVNELKKMAGKAKTIWLATDPDREGEAIAWHIAELLRNSEVKSSKLKVKNENNLRRVVFHEITEGAIKEAFEHPRQLNLQLIDAQQARRVLDRLVGYKLSPLLWKKVKRGLSAGRVQTVALRLIVEREREIGKFKAQEYWTIEVEVESLEKQVRFFVNLVEYNGKKLEIKNEKARFFISNEHEAQVHVEKLKQAAYRIEKITQKQVKRYSSPPFTTSTLQQTAGNKLGFSAKKTMMLAQNLYEHGIITYMRTDSVNLSVQAQHAIRSYIASNFDKKYLPQGPKFYKAKSKNAQEAHEAIRPTNISIKSSDISRQNGMTKDHARLYDLIWKRAVASQMADAVINQTTVDVSARQTDDAYLLRANGAVILFDGWLKLYGVTQEESEEADESFGSLRSNSGQAAQDREGSRKQILPELTEGEKLKALEVLPYQHFTQPPPRYTEASLIKKLEELGIGRPSTYAPILSTILERYYVEKQERKFVPTPLGLSVADFLLKYFPEVFDYEFTAQMENQLDEISRGERQWRESIGDFYQPFEKKLEGTMESAQRVKLEVEEVDKKCPECGKNLVIRMGRFGKFLACSGFPECKHTETLEEKVDAKCPEDGGEIVIRKTRRGKTFYGCKNWPNCKFASWTKPKSNS